MRWHLTDTGRMTIAGIIVALAGLATCTLIFNPIP